MTDGAAIALAAFHLEGPNFFAAELFHDFGFNVSTGKAVTNADVVIELGK